MRRLVPKLFVLTLLLTPCFALSQSVDAPIEEDNSETLAADTAAASSRQALKIAYPRLEEVLVTGGKNKIKTLSGSAALLDEEAIKRFDSGDIHKVLGQVPGVYIREEDGFGLRPNIGLRGASADRSQKVTVMEDGILIKPAPYSAPAAYYFPNVKRMSAVEVFKGPASIQYGPHTVGGAINLVTPSVLNEAKRSVAASIGSFNTRNVRAFINDGTGSLGYWLDALHLKSEGFKKLPDSDDTGFEKNDINAKVQQEFTLGGRDQSVVLKVGYATEQSDETYLGLSDDDFRRDPNERYTASENDFFESQHSQLHLIHSIELGDRSKVVSKLYSQRFRRAWNKVDGFISDTNPEAVLPLDILFRQAEFFQREISLLKGELDSKSDGSELIDVTTNDRQYASSGLEVDYFRQFATGELQHELQLGLRFHTDYVERDHRVKAFFVQQGRLNFDGVARPNKDDNRAESKALAVSISDVITLGKWKLTAGLRSESISGEFTDFLNDNESEAFSEREQSILLPGVGAYYQWSDTIGVLFGVNKGFSPAGPASNETVDPETSINYEAGLRYNRDALSLEAIAFFSQYDNLLGRCRASDSQCSPGEEFNGGAVEIAGLELSSSTQWRVGESLMIPFSLSYTYTDTAFQTNFQANFSQWGLVEEGDSLPYTPRHQALIALGLLQGNWSIDATAKYRDEMSDLPWPGVAPGNLNIPSLLTFDLALSYQWGAGVQLKLIAENLANQQEIVSRRPFGARPNAPRMIKFAVDYEF